MNNIKSVSEGLSSGAKAGEITLDEVAQRFEGGGYISAIKRKFKPLDKASQRVQLDKDRALREKAQAQSMTFINDEAFTDFRLVQGLYLLGGVSGKGKSTAAANILAAYAEAQPKKKAYVITNEEMSDAVLGRVACIMLRYSYTAYHKRIMPHRERNEVDDLMNQLLDYLYVVNDPAYDMGCLEDVQAVLEYARETGDVGLVLIDYHQTIDSSREHPDWEGFRVHKSMGSYLKEYGRKVDVPVVNLVQLREEGESPGFKSRVENDRTIFNHAFAAIEVVPDFDTGTTTFKIYKDRFGDNPTSEVVMRFNRGRFEPIGGGSL